MNYAGSECLYGGPLPVESGADWESEGWAAIVDSMLRGAPADMGPPSLLGDPRWAPLSEATGSLSLPLQQQQLQQQQQQEHQQQVLLQQQLHEGTPSGEEEECDGVPFDLGGPQAMDGGPSFCCSSPRPLVTRGTAKRQLRPRRGGRGKKRRRQRHDSDGSGDSDWRPQHSSSVDIKAPRYPTPPPPPPAAANGSRHTYRQQQQQQDSDDSSVSVGSLCLSSLPHPLPSHPQQQQQQEALQFAVSPFSGGLAPSSSSASAAAATAAAAVEPRLENAALNDYDMCEISVEWHLPELPETAERQKGLVPVRRVFGINAGMTLFNLHRIICISLGLEEEVSRPSAPFLAAAVAAAAAVTAAAAIPAVMADALLAAAAPGPAAVYNDQTPAVAAAAMCLLLLLMLLC